METNSPQPMVTNNNSEHGPNNFELPEIRLVEPASEPTGLRDAVRDDGLRLLEEMKLRQGVQVYQDVLPAPASMHNYLDQSLRHALRKCNGDQDKYFMPVDHLDRIICHDTISTYLSSMSQDGISNRREEILTYICGERGKIQELHTGKRVFASLILAKKADAVALFYDESINDEDLPLVKTDEVGSTFNLNRRDSQAPILRCFSGWTNGEIELFDMYQRQMKCPFFAQDANSKPLHYDLSPGISLPWTEYEKKTHSSSNSEVRRVEVHPAQHDLPPKVSRMRLLDLFHEQLLTSQKGNNLYALKTLKSDDSKEFELEVNALNKILPHSHLVTLLTTFYYKDEYHLLFPWAEGGNLMQLWKTHPKPSINVGLMRWFAEQCCGLARGLSGIHNARMLKSELAVPLDLKKSHEGDGDKDCGRHGDIKPQNILWFTQEHIPGHGTLKISDFGLTAFHSELTTKVFPDKVRGLTQSYAAPEYDTGPHVSRPYDIWSLGCIFIEFVTWILLGFEGVERFTSKRMKDRSFNNKFHLDDFYRLSEGMLGWRMFRRRREDNAVVKQSVRKVGRLRSSNSPFFPPYVTMTSANSLSGYVVS